jgi:hypothetical protein
VLLGLVRVARNTCGGAERSPEAKGAEAADTTTAPRQRLNKGAVPVASLRRPSTRRTFKSAAEWPSWADDFRFVPTDADAAWAAENLGTNDQTGDPIPDDLLAGEAEAQDRLENGLLL